MNKTLIVYLAGALDCDGSFTIYRNTSLVKLNKNAYSPSHEERIIFKQVKPEIVDLLYETFGGRKAFEKSNNPRHNDVYAWRATHIKATNCIKIILPYLRIKKPQALILLELRKRKDSKSKLYGRGKRLTPSEIASRDELHAKIKALNDTRTHQAKLFKLH